MLAASAPQKMTTLPLPHHFSLVANYSYTLSYSLANKALSLSTIHRLIEYTCGRCILLNDDYNYYLPRQEW